MPQPRQPRKRSVVEMFATTANTLLSALPLLDEKQTKELQRIVAQLYTAISTYRTGRGWI